MSYASKPIVDHDATLKPVGWAFVRAIRFDAQFMVFKHLDESKVGRLPMTAIYTQAQLDSAFADLREQRDRLKRRIRELEK